MNDLIHDPILKTAALLLYGRIETASFPIHCVAHTVDNLDDIAAAGPDIRAKFRVSADILRTAFELYRYMFPGQRALICFIDCLSGLHGETPLIDRYGYR